jgi:hypothetical protein
MWNLSLITDVAIATNLENWKTGNDPLRLLSHPITRPGMATDSSEVDAQNVLTALNELRRERGAEFTVTSATLQQRAVTDGSTVERVMQRLQDRTGVVVHEAGAGEWTVRRS